MDVSAMTSMEKSALAAHAWRRDRLKRMTVRTLYVIAPSHLECLTVMKEFALDPATAAHFRCIVKAEDLRGVSPGTPYILINRNSWPATERGEKLDAAVTILQRRGVLRPACEDDVAACRGAV